MGTRESTPRASGGSARIILSAALVCPWLAYDQWETTVPNFMRAEGPPLVLYRLLWTLNAGLILAAQPFFSRLVQWIPRVGAQLLWGNGLFVLAFGTLALFHGYWAYVTEMRLATLGERET